MEAEYMRGEDGVRTFQLECDEMLCVGMRRRVGVRGGMHPPHIRLEGGVNPPVAAIIFFAVTLFLPVSTRMAYQMQRRH